MTKMIRVRYVGPRGVCEVTLEEAQKILDNTYNDPAGGMVADARTGKMIWQIKDDIDEIIVIEHMLGGG